MPHISYERREIGFKLVYYGPGMSGKTTNLQHVHQRLADELKGDMVSLDTAEERTLFFDYLPVELGSIDGYSIRFNMYTVPGQVYYEASRRLILDGADGIVFVADSQAERIQENLLSYKMMVANMRSYRLDPDSFPVVLQYNKRDCNDPIPVGTLEKELYLNGIPVVEAVATEGFGVMDTIRILSRNVIERFQV